MKQMFSSSNTFKRLSNHIRMCGELACLLEVSATPKPGNVHRFQDFAEIRYEDFLASSVSLGIWLEELAMKGLLLKDDMISWQQMELGRTIREAVKQSNYFHQQSSNTNLGIILLLSPLSVGAGMSILEDDLTCNLDLLQRNILEAMKNTTVEDSIFVSEAIASVSPGGLGKVDQYDVTEPTLIDELRSDDVNLLKLMDLCQQRDNICFELALGYPITIKTGLSTLKRSLTISNDINLAIIDAYLAILSEYPDSLVKRKFGDEIAQRISQRATEIIKVGGALTIEGRRELEEFDIEMREEEEKINPGTTADIIASTIFVYLLSGGKLGLEKK
ncbi:MAG: ATP--dephospho-CoA triphosphoribosyl transferase CitG [Asgard group archaeon]|nr:ATP--dephospho-CoA triphosphoribosyl transferase CitG [Asgard group archaeon]